MELVTSRYHGGQRRGGQHWLGPSETDLTVNIEHRAYRVRGGTKQNKEKISVHSDLVEEDGVDPETMLPISPSQISFSRLARKTQAQGSTSSTAWEPQNAVVNSRKTRLWVYWVHSLGPPLFLCFFSMIHTHFRVTISARWEILPSSRMALQTNLPCTCLQLVHTQQQGIKQWGEGSWLWIGTHHWSAWSLRAGAGTRLCHLFSSPAFSSPFRTPYSDLALVTQKPQVSQ